MYIYMNTYRYTAKVIFRLWPGFFEMIVDKSLKDSCWTLDSLHKLADKYAIETRRLTDSSN